MKLLLLSALMALQIHLQAQHVLHLNVDLAEANATEKVYNFATDDFEGIIGWQFRMNFEGSLMKFKEIRNSILTNLNSGNFYEPIPGQLRSVWIDQDLTSVDYPEPTVLFQLVFEILAPEGTPLCFEESQEYFEFIIREGMGDFYLSELVIHDDCITGLSIFLNTTGIEDTPGPMKQPLSELYLSPQGILAFTSSQDQVLTLTLHDVAGKTVHTFQNNLYPSGRNTLRCNALAPGTYLLRTKSENGTETSTPIIAID